jgi:hypothetical protein
VISFFLDRGIDTILLVSEALRTAEMPKPDDLVSQNQNPGRLKSKEIANIEERLAEGIVREFKSQVKRLSKPYRVDVRSSSDAGDPPAGYGVATPFNDHTIYLQQTFPSAAATGLSFSIWFNESNQFPFLIRSGEENFEVRLEDVSPELTPQLHLRLANWIQRELVPMVKFLESLR